MKHFIQRHIVLLGIVFIGALAGLGFVACTSDEDVIKPSETTSAVDNTEIDHFKDVLSKTMEEGKDVDLRPTTDEVEAHVKGLPIVGTGGKKFEPVSRVYVEFTENNLSHAVKLDRLQKISTIEDVKNLIQKQGAIISLEANEFADGYVELSNEKALEIINPLIKESKQYLYGKGFTESEIQSMLSEQGKVEADLVPFVLILVEQEEYENQLFQEYGFVMNPATGLVTTSDGKTVDPKFNWNKLGSCALNALGLHIAFDALLHGAIVITKGAIRAAFISAASKLAGPVGAAIMFVDVWACYNGWW